MRRIKIKANIPKNRILHISLPKDVEQGRAEVIILVPEGKRCADLTSLITALDAHPLSSEDTRTKNEIDETIRNERASWMKA